MCHKNLAERVHIRLAYSGLEVTQERMHLEVVELRYVKQRSLVTKTANSIPYTISLRLFHNFTVRFS